MDYFNDLSTMLQISLIARAIFFFVAFTLAGIVTLKSNNHNYMSVRFLGWFLIIVGIFNVFMAIEWFNLFY